MSQEIKPCPFCGAPALMRSGMGEWWVVCSKDCGPMLATENEAIAAWNRRAPSPVVRALVEAAYIEGFKSGFDKGQSAASAYECGHGKAWSSQDINNRAMEEWKDSAAIAAVEPETEGVK